MLPTITCEMTAPAYVHDGDTIRCADGTRIRIAGVQAPDYEDTEPCRQHRAEYTCSNAAADRSRIIVERLTINRTLTCQPLGQSYARVVASCKFADGRDLSCAILKAGAATRWDSYWRRYNMPDCQKP